MVRSIWNTHFLPGLVSMQKHHMFLWPPSTGIRSYMAMMKKRYLAVLATTFVDYGIMRYCTSSRDSTHPPMIYPLEPCSSTSTVDSPLATDAHVRSVSACYREFDKCTLGRIAVFLPEAGKGVFPFKHASDVSEARVGEEYPRRTISLAAHPRVHNNK